MADHDIIAENQTAAAISKLRRGEADDSLRDEVLAATLSTLQKLWQEMTQLKESMWSRGELKSLITEEQEKHCTQCPTRKWVEGEIARSTSRPGGNWFVELVKSETLRYFILVAILVYALIYVKSGIDGVQAVKESVSHTMTGGLK